MKEKCAYCGLESETPHHDSYITCAGKLRARVRELEAQVKALDGPNPYPWEKKDEKNPETGA